jgi:aryl-alcohol dehydrogenase-like predicted oxidoreductase
MADIAPVVETHKATPAQVVIAWTLRQPGITFSLCGARNPAQARENAAAGRIRLSSSEINTISEAASRHLTNLDA